MFGGNQPTSGVGRFREHATFPVDRRGHLGIRNNHGQAHRGDGQKHVAHLLMELIAVRPTHTQQLVQLGTRFHQAEPFENLESKEREETGGEWDDFEGEPRRPGSVQVPVQGDSRPTYLDESIGNDGQNDAVDEGEHGGGGGASGASKRVVVA